jgi:hypothetical protein
MKQDLDGLGNLQREQARDLGEKIAGALGEFQKTAQGFFVKVVLAILGISLVNVGAVVAIIQTMKK